MASRWNGRNLVMPKTPQLWHVAAMGMYAVEWCGHAVVVDGWQRTWTDLVMWVAMTCWILGIVFLFLFDCTTFFFCPLRLCLFCVNTMFMFITKWKIMAVCCLFFFCFLFVYSEGTWISTNLYINWTEFVLRFFLRCSVLGLIHLWHSRIEYCWRIRKSLSI